MSHVTSFPAASHLFDHIAWSPLIETYCFKLEKRISNSVALTVIKEFSLNLFAVSLTTAKASGKISFNFSSTLFSDDSFTLSISW